MIVKQSTQTSYDHNASWFTKIKFILEKENKPLTTSQIADGIMFYEPKRKRRLVITTISSILRTKSKDEKYLKRYMEGEDQKFTLI